MPTWSEIGIRRVNKEHHRRFSFAGSELEHSSDLTETLSRLRSFTLSALLQSHPDLLDPHGVGLCLTKNRRVGELLNNGIEVDNIEIKSSRLPRKWISEKKHHEVDVMGSSLLRLRSLVEFNTLVDVGCGLGYLEEELRQRLRTTLLPEVHILYPRAGQSVLRAGAGCF